MNVALVYMNNETNVGRGAGYIAGAILRKGHRLSFFDTLYDPPHKVADTVAEGGFDVLMISTMTILFPKALELIRMVKERVTIPVLVGGIHAAIEGKSLLERHGEIDYLCVGEGETMVGEFLEKLGDESLFSVANLAYRKDGEVIQNPLGPAENLDTLPEFPWHLFKPRSIVLPESGFLYVDATRGCPYNCTYCCNGIYLSKYGKSYLRYRPVEEVVEELRRLKETYHPRLFYFGDEMILSHPEYATALFTAIREELDTPYGCMARVEHITGEIADLFKRTGCRYMAMGVECGDEEFRKKHLNRRMTNEQIERAFATVKSAGVFATSFNMIGYPFDFDDRLTEATVALNEKIRPDYVQISIFYPLPGTKMYDYCVENDLIDHQKMARLENYFSDSPLKGVSLKETKAELTWRLNPSGFLFSLDGDDAGARLSLGHRLERAAYLSPAWQRWAYRIMYRSALHLKQMIKRSA